MPRVAFISFRLKAMDGVSAEAEKRISAFEEWGFEVYRVAGYIPGAGDGDHIIPEMNFRDPQIEAFTAALFGSVGERTGVERELAEITTAISSRLEPLLEEIAPDIIIAENVFSIPLNLPLTIAACNYLERTGSACIAIHHELIWDSGYYSASLLEDVVQRYFPASLPQIRHVTIDEGSREEIYKRTGMAATCWRNCFDFEVEQRRDALNADFRSDLGIAEDEMMFLQPTRTIERKAIDSSIRFVEDFATASGHRARLVVTGPCEADYSGRFEEMCRNSSVDVIHQPDIVGVSRDEVTAYTYDIQDLYIRSDIVTFPNSREGFGNPVLESVLHRKPLLVADYPALKELRAFGFQFLALDRHAVERTIKLLDRPQLMQEMLDRNFEIGRKYFSMDVMRRQIEELVFTVPLMD